MTEQIYIDGQLLDLDTKQKGVQLVYQSPYFTDLKSIVSNRTNTISVPKTANNIRVFGYVGTQVEGVFPYRTHKVIYKRDGVQMLSGTATLLGTKKDTFSLCFVWGNNNVFEPLFNTSLPELAITGERYANQYAYQPTTDYPHKVQTGLGRLAPALQTSTILSRIQQLFRLSGLTGFSAWDNTAVMCLTRKGDAVTEQLQAFDYGTGSGIESKFTTWKRIDIQLLQTYYANARAILTPNNGSMRDLFARYDNNNALIDISSASRISLKIAQFSGFMYYYHVLDTLRQQAVSQIGEERFGLFVLLFDSISDAEPKVIDLVGGFSSRTTEIYDIYTREYGFYSAPAQDIEFETEGYAYMAISFVAGNHIQSSATHWTGVASDRRVVVTSNDINASISFIEDKGDEKEVVWGTGLNSLPMFRNLPDISCGQFIKNLMLFTGRFAYCKQEGVIAFTTIRDLYDNRRRAVDWTQKIVGITESKTRLDDNARVNWLKLAEDDAMPNNLNGKLVVDDDGLTAERDLFVSDFALAYDNFVPMWQRNDDNEVEFVGDARKPRILQGYARYGNVSNYAYNQSQAFSEIVKRYYQQYQQVIYHPVVLSVEVLMTTADLHTLDLTIPVYLKQTGRHYCIKQLTTKNGALCNATLIQL